jgi:SulP family sulfate permease
MSEWRSFCDLLKWSKGSTLVLVATFLLTVFVDLNAAIEVGVVLSAFIFMKRMSETTNIKMVANEFAEEEKGEDRPLPAFVVPDGVEVYEINGPLFFGAASQFDEIDRQVNGKPKVRILRFRDVPLIDSTGMHAFKSFHAQCQRDKIHLIVTGLHVQPLNEMIKSNLYDLIGEANVFSNMPDAMARAKEFLS